MSPVNAAAAAGTAPRATKDAPGKHKQQQQQRSRGRNRSPEPVAPVYQWQYRLDSLLLARSGSGSTASAAAAAAAAEGLAAAALASPKSPKARMRTAKEAAVADREPAALVGKRITVRWPKNKIWYEAVVEVSDLLAVCWGGI